MVLLFFFSIKPTKIFKNSTTFYFSKFSKLTACTGCRRNQKVVFTNRYTSKEKKSYRRLLDTLYKMQHSYWCCVLYGNWCHVCVVSPCTVCKIVVSFKYIKVYSRLGSSYGWRLYQEEWSKCDSICEGYQYRKPVCVELISGKEVPHGYCGEMDESVIQKQVCNSHCELTWNIASKSVCSSPCGKG